MSAPPLGKPILTEDLCEFMRAWLRMNGFRLGDTPGAWRVTAGPNSHKRAGQEICVAPAPGGGLTQEWSVEGLSWQLRVYGPQARNDTDNMSSSKAEQMAWILDRMMITMEASGMQINQKRVISSQRFGAAPAEMPKDRAGRANYVATYVWEVASGL